MVDFNIMLEAKRKAFESKNIKEYIERAPAFYIDGMNQEEFIRHVYSLGFYKGARYIKDKNE